MEMGLQVYVKGSVAAVALYQKAFGAALGYHVLNDDGTFMHAELEAEGKPILAVSESPNDIGWRLLKEYSPSVRPTMNFGVTLRDEAAVKHAYEVLSQDGVIVLPLGRLPWSDCCADVIDRFGVFWYVSVAGHRPDED